MILASSIAVREWALILRAHAGWFVGIGAVLLGCVADGSELHSARDAQPDASGEVDARDDATAVPEDDVSDVHAGDALDAEAGAVDTATDATDATSPTINFAPAPVVADAAFADFFRHDRVQPIELRVEQAEWDALIAHMLEYAAVDDRMRTGRYFRATFVYTAADGHEQTLGEVGFRTRGNTTRVLPEAADGRYQRAHFKLKFDATFDLEPGTTAYRDRDERRFRGLKELNLKWERDDDPSQIRELYAFEMFRRVGAQVPRTAPVALTLTIGGVPVYFGLYLGLEEIDKPFLRRRLGSLDNDGDLYKCLWLHEGPATLEPVTNPRAIGSKDWQRDYRPSYDLATNEATSEHARLRELITQLDELDGEGLRSWLDSHFEVETFLRTLAMNVLIGMPDDYWAMGNNYYLYFGPERALFIPWDYDHGLGGGWGGEPVWSHEGIATADVFTWMNLNAAWWRPDTRHPLVDKVLAIAAYRERYVALLRAFIDPGNELFGPATWEAMYATQAPLYAPWLVNDTGEGQRMERTGVEQAFMATKLRSVREQLDADR